MNNSNTSSSSDEVDSELQESCDIFSLMISGVGIVICCVVCYIGNSLSLATFRRPRRASPTIVLLQALAVVDIILLIPALFVSAIPKLCRYADACHWYTDIFQVYLVAYTWPITTMAHVATIWFTVLVTVHRYLAVCKPLNKYTSKFDQTRAAYIQVCVVMAASVVYNIPRFFEYRPKCSDNANNQTVCVYEDTSMLKNTYYQLFYRNISFFAFMNVIPLGVLSVLTYKLIRELRRASSNRKNMAATNCNSTVDRDKGLTRTLLVVVIVFMFCQTPAAITRLLGFILDRSTRHECGEFLFYFPKVSNLLVFVNSSVNFFIYCFCSRSFRANLARLVCCRGSEPSVTYGSEARSSHVTRTNRQDFAGKGDISPANTSHCCMALFGRTHTHDVQKASSGAQILPCNVGVINVCTSKEEDIYICQSEHQEEPRKDPETFQKDIGISVQTSEAPKDTMFSVHL